MGHHHLDDVAHARSWLSIVVVHPSGDVALPHCHCCWCAQWLLGWLSDGCGRWLLVAVVATHVLMRVEGKEAIGLKSCQFWNMNRSHVSLGWAC